MSEPQKSKGITVANSKKKIIFETEILKIYSSLNAKIIIHYNFFGHQDMALISTCEDLVQTG